MVPLNTEPAMTATAVRDLADQVQNFLAEHVTDDALAGFAVHRHLVDGTAAVTYRPGVVPAYPAVLRWTLHSWAQLLRDAGYAVAIDACDDRDQKDVPQMLRVLGRSEPQPPRRTKPSRRAPNDNAFPALARDIAEQVTRQHATGATLARFIDAAIDERGLSHIGTPTREVLHGAVRDVIDSITTGA